MKVFIVESKLKKELRKEPEDTKSSFFVCLTKERKDTLVERIAEFGICDSKVTEIEIELLP